MEKTHPLLGKIITSISIAEDRMAIKFDTTDDSVIGFTDADCCSSTWIEHIELPAYGFPAKVIEVAELELPGSDNEHPVHDCLQVYGLKVLTDKGEIIIDYRNASNGYYGGSLLFTYDYHYGGVYGQNISKQVWVEVIE